jgi:hypothetical protein
MDLRPFGTLTIQTNPDGRADWSEGLGRGAVYSTARLESGDERYRWVNHLPLASKGAVLEGGGVAHELFELV